MSDISKKDTVKEEAAKSEKKAKKNGVFARIGKFFREIRGELRKISWPTLAEVVKNTIITLVVVAIIGAFIGLIDWGFSSLRDWAILQARGGEESVSEEVDAIPSEVEEIVGNVAAASGVTPTDAE